MFDVVLLDGITGAGKSTLFRALESSPWAREYESRLILAQSYTLRVARPGGIVDHLLSLAETIRDCASMHASSEFATRTDGRGSMLVLAEGFHLYGLLEHVAENQRIDALRRIEDVLCGVPVTLTSLEMDSQVILERSVHSPLRFRGPGWGEFVRQFGSTPEEIRDYYIRRQSMHMELVSSSSLAMLRLNTSSAEWDSYTRQIIDHVAERGGQEGV